jgi:hypothetical protein
LRVLSITKPNKQKTPRKTNHLSIGKEMSALYNNRSLVPPPPPLRILE